MIIFLLIAIVLAAFGVVGWLFYAVKKEDAVRVADSEAVPIMNSSELFSADHRETGDPVAATPVPEADVLQVPVSSAPFHGEDPQTSIAVLQAKEELKTVREKAVAQAKSALEVINKLRDENDVLRGQLKETEGLQGAAESVGEDPRHLKAEIVALREELRIREADAEAAFRLKEENEVLRRNILSKEDADVLQREKEALSSRKNFLEADNAGLREKNEFLQYELTKVRAQVAGLEKMCEHSRKKLEGLIQQQ